MPVAEGIEGARLLEGGLHACSTLAGPYEPEAFTAIYAGLVKWIDESEYHMAGAPFDVYVKGSPEVDPQDYITEAYFPISK